MPVHSFDIAVDGCYDPSSTPDVYLTEAQVLRAISLLSFREPQNLAAIQLIIEQEKLQREKCLGVISQSDKSTSTRLLHKNYQLKFHCWAYATEAYKEFYRHFGVDDE